MTDRLDRAEQLARNGALMRAGVDMIDAGCDCLPMILFVLQRQAGEYGEIEVVVKHSDWCSAEGT